MIPESDTPINYPGYENAGLHAEHAGKKPTGEMEEKLLYYHRELSGAHETAGREIEKSKQKLEVLCKAHPQTAVVSLTIAFLLGNKVAETKTKSSPTL